MLSRKLMILMNNLYGILLWRTWRRRSEIPRREEFTMNRNMRNSGFKYLAFIFFVVLLTKGYSQDALEPNDSFASATIRTITSYNTTYSSINLRISAQNDLDYFKIQVGRGVPPIGIAPVLSWTEKNGYAADGLDPAIINQAAFRINCRDTDNDAPITGYPNVHARKAGVEISGSPFTMESANSDAFSTGRIYQKSMTIAAAGTDYTYAFEALDALGNTATGEPVTARAFTVNNPVPVVSTLDPAQKTLNSSELSLTVNGINFVEGSVVQFVGQDRATQFISSTQLTATLLASDLATLGAFRITVFNPAPGGGTSTENIFLTVTVDEVDGLVAYYPFNNSPNDESGNGNHGTFTGSPTPAADRFGRANRAFYFDGTDDAVVINMSYPMVGYSVGPHSYSVWVNRPARSGDIEFIVDAGGGSQDQRGIRYTRDGLPTAKWVISSSIENTTASFEPSYNAWHHLVGVYTGTEVSLYVDGQLASSRPKSGTGVVLSIMKIGNISESANPYQNFTGYIDDVRIYNKALAAQEVQELLMEQVESENRVPELLWPATPGYDSDGVEPDLNIMNGAFIFKVTFRDADNDSPMTGYPKVHIKKGGVEISGSPFTMEPSNSDAFVTGRIFQKELTISAAGADYTYAFEAQDVKGHVATGEPVSSEKSFTVINPWPMVSAIDPAQKMVNSGEFTLTVNGQYFINGSVVRFAGQDRATQFVNSTQLTATILAADLTTSGVYPITVFNPAPGGGVSEASVVFTVAPLPSGTLYAHYPLAGDAIDISGNERNGTVYQAAATSDKAGTAGQALLFDGLDDYVGLPFASQALGSAMTITAWVYRTGSSFDTSVQGIISNDVNSNRGISIGAYPVNGPSPASANKLQVSVYNSLETGSDLLGLLIPLDEWQYVATVADGVNLKIYQDGQLQGSTPFSGNLRGSANFHIGHDQYDASAGRFWQGKIDNVRFYNRALTTTEISDIYALEGSGAANSHTLSLPAGWSMISSYVIPADNALPVLFSDIVADMTILKNGSGDVYWPQYTINTIGTWNHLAGYYIFMKNNATFEVTGQAILPESTPISLNQGWNLISYLRDTGQDVTTALSNLVSTMVIAKNGAGHVYWPAFSLNTIGNMMPGAGYQLYMNQAATLTYAANSLAKDEGGSPIISFTSHHYQPFLTNSGRNSIIGIKGGNMEEGDEVSAWTLNGRLLAAGAIAQNRTVLVIPGDDPMTKDVVEGCAEDEILVFRVWRRSDGLELPMADWYAEDALTGTPLGDQLAYRTDAVTIVRTSASALSTVSGYKLEQNFPNPFNPETSIRFSLPQAAAVRLVIMNLQGQQMRILVDEQCASGSHTIVWDGRDDDDQPVASGLYIVRMVAGEFTANQKISFIK